MAKINSNAKGKKGERDVADVFKEWGYIAKRGQQHSGSSDSPDVIAPGFAFHIEVKRTEALQLDKAMAQSTRDAAGKKYPCVIHRRNNTDWKFTCNLTDLLTLLKKSGK